MVQKYPIFTFIYIIYTVTFEHLNMNNLRLIIAIFCLLPIISCEKSEEIVQKPLIRFQEPSLDTFSIGENIPVNISVKHHEILHSVKYYEIFDCSDDNYDSIELLEEENIDELEWYFQKDIGTNLLPKDLNCVCTIEVEATDINQLKTQNTISLSITNNIIE